MIPVLPHLVTSTDEVTVFATPNKIHGSDSYYLVAKPTVTKNENADSSNRNNYKTKIFGDSHCRGVRIVINNTFTAGGLSSPIFVTVYGLTQEEMPVEEIVTIEVPGLTVGSDQDLYSKGKGFLTFVRGNYDADDEVSDSNESNVDDNTHLPSKEARVAKIYQDKVFYPFIQYICKLKYGLQDDMEDEIPDNLTAVAWMDGANAQIKLITDEESLRHKEKLKTRRNKNSAARTSVEQAANTGPMFKMLKKILLETDSPNASNNSIFFYLQDTLKSLHNGTPTNPRHQVRLQTHKYKAILTTLSKLPSATGRAYTLANVMKGFMLNGQLDAESMLMPSFDNLIHTY